MPTTQFKKPTVPPKNEVKRYLPLRNKGNKFLWKSIAGEVLAYSTGLRVKKFDFDHFESQCKGYFDKSDPKLWPTVKATYFADRTSLLKLDPRFSVLGMANPSKSGAKANLRMASVFKDLLGTNQLMEGELAPAALNFIESKILDQVTNLLTPKPIEAKSTCYLPFLQTTFCADLKFLSRHPQYMLNHLEEFLKLYAMAYCSQLALNVRNFSEAPVSRPLYFILANEKSGAERVHVTHDGMKLLRSNLEAVFPVLSMAEAIQAELQNDPVPLWTLYETLQETSHETSVIEALNQYATEFAEQRNVEPQPHAGTLADVFKNLIKVSMLQFNETTREGVNKKYVTEFEDHVFQDFTQSRGRAGKVLVLAQDQLLLLTNLIVGEENRIWFKNVLKGLRDRGIFLDKRSELALVDFYERIGNVERKSDSGDAIYITKTL